MGNQSSQWFATIITLKASYLNTLSAGTHTVEILWTDGSASTTFTIKANTSDNSNNNQNDNNNSDSSGDKPSSGTDKKDVAPKTGDNTPSVWLFILSILSGTGLIITVKKRRENLNS
ncbi:LPXTG cell wall anchor domain-containing protein [Roseburia inulinivorans]